jgi:hypothetical protein
LAAGGESDGAGGAHFEVGDEVVSHHHEEAGDVMPVEPETSGPLQGIVGAAGDVGEVGGIISPGSFPSGPHGGVRGVRNSRSG